MKRRATRACLAAIAALAVGALGCDRERGHEADTLSLPVQVIADTGRSRSLRVEPPPDARVWVARVAPSIGPIVAPRGAPPLPEATPDTVFPDLAPPLLDLDDRLEPPILRAPAVLRVPAGWRPSGAGVESVELDVRVDESGEVSDARWAGGSGDSALVDAALRCALGMRFYPALQAGRPVPVWCRQRFDFRARR